MHIVKSFALAVLMLALAVCAVGTGEAAQWDGGTIRVVGLGVAPAGTSGTQAEALTRQHGLRTEQAPRAVDTARSGLRPVSAAEL